MRLDNKKTFSYGKKSEESSDVLFLKWVTEYSLENLPVMMIMMTKVGDLQMIHFVLPLKTTSILFIQPCEATGAKYSGIL